MAKNKKLESIIRYTNARMCQFLTFKIFRQFSKSKINQKNKCLKKENPQNLQI